MQGIVRLWMQYGKATIVKRFITSQLVYPLSVLPSPSPATYKEIEIFIFRFVWNNKPDKIKRKVMLAENSNGVLNLPNMLTKKQGTLSGMG